MIDFELAQEIGEPRVRGKGTPHFVAPEQWKGGHASPRADLFGLAACTHASLTGRVPVSKLFRRPALQPYIRPDRWDERYEEVEPVITKGFRRKPENRQANVAEFCHELQEAHERGRAAKRRREGRTYL